MLTYSRYSKALGLLFAISLLTAASCGSKSESSDGSCLAGAERCSCNSNGGCDDGLVCATNINQCVRLAGTGTGGNGTTGSGGDGSGGTTASGGRGGTPGTGGTTATGGTTGTGGNGATGSAGQGGTSGTGGTTATGGTKGTGGTPGTGGTKGTGGTPGTGGTTATGGTKGTGGSSTGGTTGTGGTSGGPCTWNSGPNSNSGEITCYNFGQGTAKGGGCSSYKTYCGYCGSESGSGSGICPSGINDTVSNTGTNTYFAAFPVGTFGQGKYCGMCVDVTWMGKSITATIVDECATCPTASHIDLSESAAAALGLGQGSTTGDATSGVTWKAVDCPVTGNIVAVFNNGSSGQVYFQNVVFPVANAVAGGHTASQSYGYWDFGGSVGGQSVTLTDTVGHVVTGTIPGSSGGSVGAQFPMTCQ